MPKSRSKNAKVLYCPGCGLSCHSGPERLARHIKNQCRGEKVRAAKK